MQDGILLMPVNRFLAGGIPDLSHHGSLPAPDLAFRPAAAPGSVAPPAPSSQSRLTPLAPPIDPASDLFHELR
jgi:hypothetical protein